LFADDLKIFYFEQTVLQEAITALFNWSRMWQLPLNLKKLEHLRIGKIDTPNATPLNVGGEPIAQTSSTRDLGVIIDRGLTFTEHVKKIATEGMKKVKFILRRFKFLSKKALVQLFVTTVRSSLEYSSTVWNPSSKLLSSSMEKVQRTFTKGLRGLSTLSYEKRLENLQLPTLEQRRCLLDQLMLYKISSGTSCLPFDLFFQRPPAKVLQLRGHSKRLFHPIRCHGMERRLFWIRCLKKWNNLPQPVVISKSAEQFKTLCVQYV
jgi:hypothetical protein